jgi:hypothetical protein
VAVQEAVDDIAETDEYLDASVQLWQACADEGLTNISGRRWGEIGKLAATEAVFAGRDHLIAEDLRVAQHCLWKQPSDRDLAYELTLPFMSAFEKNVGQIRDEYEEQAEVVRGLRKQVAEGDAGAGLPLGRRQHERLPQEDEGQGRGRAPGGHRPGPRHARARGDDRANPGRPSLAAQERPRARSGAGLMTLLDRAKSFFRRRPELTDATIKRTRIDESIARDMRRKARVLDEAFTSRSDRGEGRDPRAPFEGWEGLLTDAYCAHVGLNEPELTPEDEIKPSAELARRTMASYVRSEAFGEARGNTRDDPIASAFATVEAARMLRESMEDGELQQHATRAAEMEAVEQSIEELVNELEAAQAQGDDAPDVQGMIDEAQADLERLVDEQEESNLRGAVATVAKRAAEAGEKRAEVASRLPGNQPGSGLTVSPDEAFDLAERWTGVEEMWDLAMQLGRTKTSMSADRATREVGGHEELVGLERGDDLSRTIPSELMRFRDPRTRRLFMVDWLEGDLLQHASVGELPAIAGRSSPCATVPSR